MESSLVSGDVRRNIWQLTWPMLIIMVLNFLVGIADIFVAGLIGPKVQAAVGFVTQIYFLIIIVANAISIGTLALVSRATGAGNRERALSVARQSLIFSIFVSLLIMAVFLGFSREIIALAGFPAEIREMAQRFLVIFTFAMGPNYILIIASSIFRATGEVKKPLIAMTIVSTLNILGDFALVFGFPPIPALGYQGIAMAGAISVSAGTLACLLMFTSRRWEQIYRDRWRVSLATINAIAKIGWPAALLQISWNLATIFIYNILGKVKGESIVALAAIANGLRIEAIIYLPAFALNMAASVLVGQNLGAARPDRAERLAWLTAWTGVAIMSTMALIVFIWAEFFASLVAQDRAVVAETVRYLRINMFAEPFLALSLVLGGGLQGAGDTRTTMWAAVIAMWAIRLPAAWLLTLTLDWGPPGAWTAMAGSMVVQGIFLSWRFRQGKWKHIKVD